MSEHTPEQPQDNLTTFIYALIDPLTDFVRYVGKANNPKHRFSMHLTPKSLEEKTHKNAWLLSLLDKKERPRLIIVEIVSRCVWKDAERKWIAFYRNIPGYPDLTNTTDGGEGVEGYVPSEEERRKRSERQKGTTHTASARAKISAAHKGRIHTKEARKNMSNGCKKRWNILSEEGKQKQIGNLHKHTKTRNNTSGFSGVGKSGDGGWFSYITYNGIHNHIGSFPTAEEAARARDKYILSHIGENIILNFPRSEYAFNPEIYLIDQKRSNRRPLANNNTSGYKGVYLIKGSLKWRASIFYNKKNVSISTFDNKIDAAKAYDRAVIELLDPLAYTNFPRAEYA